MLNFLKIFLLTALVTACSWTDALNLVSPTKDGGIDTELVIGDKNQAVNTEIGRQEAQTIVNNDNSDYFPYILAMIALMLPTPTTMWNAWRNRNVK